MTRTAGLDRKFVWHPFTQMRDWMREDPIVITSGRGSWLKDEQGRSYLDANSSIWTNLHGHSHPAINKAMRVQMERVSHVSALGLANKPASLLASKLVQAARQGRGQPQLGRVFYSDNGSTALETALKLAHEFTRRTRGGHQRPRFLSLAGGYHGDTVGAVSLGHIDLFHKAYRDLLFPTDKVMAPYCYRCPYNRAKPERADARVYRRCQWECIGQLEKKLARQNRRDNPFAAFVFEPLVQGAAGVIPQPEGWLRKASERVRASGALLVADEVMTGFGRTNTGPFKDGRPCLFACQEEQVQPDFLCLAKGLTGGYLPMAATLVTQRIFDAFLGKYEEFKTFFHGHSYTANPLGAAAALASLKLLNTTATTRSRLSLAGHLKQNLSALWNLSHVGDIRQVGSLAGIELVQDWKTRQPYPLKARAGMRVCQAMARRGVLTRPIGNVILLMPPYCTTSEEVAIMVATLNRAIRETLGNPAKMSTRPRPENFRKTGKPSGVWEHPGR